MHDSRVCVCEYPSKAAIVCAIVCHRVYHSVCNRGRWIGARCVHSAAALQTEGATLWWAERLPPSCEQTELPSRVGPGASGDCGGLAGKPACAVQLGGRRQEASQAANPSFSLPPAQATYCSASASSSWAASCSPCRRSWRRGSRAWGEWVRGGMDTSTQPGKTCSQSWLGDDKKA